MRDFEVPEGATSEEVPIFVPVAFSVEEARALCHAARAMVVSASFAGHAGDPLLKPLAQAMVRLAKAVDKACDA